VTKNMFREHYIAEAAKSVGKLEARNFTTRDILTAAADAAVLADRQRMAEQLRGRILGSHPDLPEHFQMQVERLLFDIANDIEQGFPLRP